MAIFRVFRPVNGFTSLDAGQLLANNIYKIEYNTDAMSTSLIYLFLIFCP